MSTNPLLPILAPESPRKSTAEKYGGLFYLAVAGLIALVALIGLFAYGVWSMRSVWGDVYTLNDANQSILERNNAAWRLARDPRVTDRQRWDLAMNRELPPLARYLLAESLTGEAARADPRGYALAVARSEGWPRWLRLLVMRPIVYSASVGGPVDREVLRELQEDIDDPIIGMFAALARSWDDDPAISTAARRRLDENISTFGGSFRSFAEQLRETSRLPQPRLRESLDATAPWLRRHATGAANVWRGWEETPAGIVRTEAAPPAPAQPAERGR